MIPIVGLNLGTFIMTLAYVLFILIKKKQILIEVWLEQDLMLHKLHSRQWWIFENSTWGVYLTLRLGGYLPFWGMSLSGSLVCLFIHSRSKEGILRFSDVLLLESEREYVTSSTTSFGEITDYPPGDHVSFSALYEGIWVMSWYKVSTSLYPPRPPGYIRFEIRQYR